MTDIPNPTPESVAIWLKNGLDRRTLHEQGWKDANQRFHGITRAARPYILQHFKTPEEQAAAFDGLTLALITLGHFDDIGQIAAALKDTLRLEASQTSRAAKGRSHREQ